MIRCHKYRKKQLIGQIFSLIFHDVFEFLKQYWYPKISHCVVLVALLLLKLASFWESPYDLEEKKVSTKTLSQHNEILNFISHITSKLYMPSAIKLKWIFYLFVSGQIGPFWAILKVLLNYPTFEIHNWFSCFHVRKNEKKKIFSYKRVCIFFIFYWADKKKCFPISEGYLLFLWQIKLRQKVHSMTTLVEQSLAWDK